MHRPLRSTLAALGLVAGLAPGLAPRLARQDRPAAPRQIAALVDSLRHEDQALASGAERELVALGAAAVPQLVARVRTGSDDVGWVRAVRVLGRIGEPAAPAVPVLLDALSRSGGARRSALVFALGQCGPYSRHGARIREALVAAFGETPPGDAIAALQLTVGARPVEAFRTYARTLLDPRAPEGRIVAALADENPFVREFAAELLADPRRHDDAGMPALRAMLGRPQPATAMLGEARLTVFFDRRIHAQVAKAIVRRAPGDPRSEAAFRYLLERPVAAERMEGLLALRRAGAQAERLVPVLVSIVEQDEDRLRGEAITVLGMIGPPAAAAVEVLEPLLKSTDQQLAARARAALARIRGR